MTRRTYQTSRRQLLADRFATVVFTVTGVAVIAAVLGMLVFFVATVVPLFVPVQFEVQRQKTVHAEWLSFVRDPDSPFLGEFYRSVNGQCILATAVSPAATDAAALGAESGLGQMPREMGRLAVRWPPHEDPRLESYRTASSEAGSANTPVADQSESEPFLCFGGSSSQLLLVSERRVAIVQLSADREFLTRDQIADLSAASQEHLRKHRWLFEDGNLYAQASDVAPPARVFASLKKLLLLEDHAAELFALLAQPAADLSFQFVSGAENRSLLYVSLLPQYSAPTLSEESGTVDGSLAQPPPPGVNSLPGSAPSRVNLALLALAKENMMTGAIETSSRWLELPAEMLGVSIAGSGSTVVVVLPDGTVRFVDWASAWESGISQARSMGTTYGGRALAASVSFGLNTLLMVGEDAKCRAYDIGFYALQRSGEDESLRPQLMKPRFESDCIPPAPAGDRPLDSGAVILVSHPARRLAFLLTEDLVLSGIDLTTGENIVRVSVPSIAKDLQLKNGRANLSEVNLAFEKTGEFAILSKRLGGAEIQDQSSSEVGSGPLADGAARLEEQGDGRAHETHTSETSDQATQKEASGRLSKAIVELRLHAENIEGSLTRMFRKIHYESYSSSSYSWQSASATNDFEAKFSLMPLLWGTLKATFYAMLFAGPLGILAAVYSSEILDRRTRNFVKPAIEMMASLPSVVLGFLAAIVLAPWIEANILGVILCGLVLPFCLYFFGNVVSQYSARHVSGRGLYASRRLLFAIFFGFLIAFFALLRLGHVVEKFAFAGDIKAFLAGGSGSSGVLYGILILPLVLLGLWSVPWIPSGKFKKYWRTSVFVFGPFLSLAMGAFLQNHFGETHLSIAGYSQRNALVICVAMGFAIIPIIYSLSEDAFTSVPGSLRAGSLACGASVWQTTARVILPTAASGVFSAVMIGFGRAIGETMIVVMATGNSPIMSLNPFDGLRTLSANIAVELPEAPMGGTHYRILFFSGMALFVLTFVMNTAAEIMRTKYRKRNKAL